MMLDAEKIAGIFDEYERDLIDEHIKLVMLKSPEKKTTITAAMITAVREIRNRIRLPEIKK